MTSRSARIARASATAVVVFSLAAGAHLAGGSALPNPLILTGLGMITLLAVTVLARRKLPLTGVLAVIAAGQVLLHEAFSTLTTTAACIPATRNHFGPQQVHCAPAGVLEHAHGAVLFESPVMMGTHAAAVVATALMLSHGETALELALQWFRPLSTLPRVPTCPPLADLPLVPVRPARTYLSPLLDIRPLRGPPLSLCS